MEYLPQTLDAFIKDEKEKREKDKACVTASVANMRVLGAELADVLLHLHKNDTLYRDLKPENVMLKAGADEDVLHICLIDFGYSKKCSGGGEMFFMTGAGNFQTAPPEIFKARMEGQSATHKGFTHTVDVWTYGVTLMMMLKA